MTRSLCLFIFVGFICSTASAQLFGKKRHKARRDDPVSQPQPNSLTPYYPDNPKEEYSPSEKQMTAVHHFTYDQEVKEFYERRERVMKERAKMERLMKKPQYSDPSYFGHKHKPRKHPPGKMKYCKECGIWH